MKQRLFYIDYIRLFLCCVVIFHHTAISFGASGGWYYFSPVRLDGLSQLLYSIQMGIDQSYFMALFFFVSALFTPKSVDKKGIKGFLKDRFFRLAIPMLVYVFVLNPILIVSIYGMEAGYQQQLGPLWFVFSLIVFEFTYLFIRRFNLPCPNIKINSWTMGLFALLIGLLAFVLRIFVDTHHATMGIVFANFVSYIAMYVLGILVSRLNILDSSLDTTRSYKWLSIAVFTWLSMLAVASNNVEQTAGGLNYVSLVYSVWEAVSCVALSYFLLAMGRRYFNVAHKFFLPVASNSFMAFVIHPFPVVFLTMLMEKTGVCPELLIPITSVLAIVASFLIAQVLRGLLRKLNYYWV